MRRGLAWLAALSALAAWLTWVMGWSGAALTGAVAGYLAPRAIGPLRLAVAAVILGWIGWLLVDVRAAAFGEFMGMVTEIIGRPLPVLAAATVALGGMLGFGGGLVGVAFRHPLRR